MQSLTQFGLLATGPAVPLFIWLGEQTAELGCLAWNLGSSLNLSVLQFP